MLNRLQDVFKSFQQHDVKYVVIGGIASILHGVPRATFDLDILIEASSENTSRLLDALVDAGLGTASLTTPADVLANEITIFRDRVRIDVHPGQEGVVGRRVEAACPGLDREPAPYRAEMAGLGYPRRQEEAHAMRT